MNQQEALGLAADIARDAGSLLRARFDGGREVALATKSTPTDLVSQADLESQRTIRVTLERSRPDDGFLGEEEGGDVPGTSGFRWIVDPLDGTVNFLYGIPQWCVSIACEDADGTLAGVVYDPMRDELFSATRGGPAQLNGAVLNVPRVEDLSQALVATGFAYSATVRAAQGPVVERLIPRVRDLRRLGSAALDLCWAACGRVDAYYERTAKPWDIAAGALVCVRAGLDVRDLPERDEFPYGIQAAAPAIADELFAIVS